MRADQPAPTWTRSERPDGHRSLWCMVDRWYTLTAVDGFFSICASGSLLAAPRESEIPSRCAMFHLPTPTADDLAWLRGAG